MSSSDGGSCVKHLQHVFQTWTILLGFQMRCWAIPVLTLLTLSPELWWWRQELQMTSRNAHGRLSTLGVKFSLIMACLREEPIREAIFLEPSEECVAMLASQRGEAGDLLHLCRPNGGPDCPLNLWESPSHWIWANGGRRALGLSPPETLGFFHPIVSLAVGKLHG